MLQIGDRQRTTATCQERARAFPKRLSRNKDGLQLAGGGSERVKCRRPVRDGPISSFITSCVGGRVFWIRSLYLLVLQTPHMYPMSAFVHKLAYLTVVGGDCFIVGFQRFPRTSFGMKIICVNEVYSCYRNAFLRCKI